MVRFDYTFGHAGKGILRRDLGRAGRKGALVTTTARWPKRLRHVATLLRAEAATVLTVSGSDVTAVFVHRVNPSLDWLALLGATVVERALRSQVPIGAALPAGPWDDRVAYAVLARLGTQVAAA